MNNLLLEVFTEELPAAYIPAAARALGEITAKKLAEAGIGHGAIRAYGTPRRIVMMVDGLPEKQETRSRKVAGPPKKAAVAADGSFTNVALGFAKKHGVGPEALKTETTPKGEYLYVEVMEGGQNTADLFATLLPQAITSLPFPKTMRWGNGETRFARPLRGIVALLGERRLSFSIEDLHAGDATLGHRFTSSGPVTITSPAAYERILEQAGVIADPEKRRASIVRQFDELAAQGLNPIRHADLMEEVCYLTENPVAVVGSFKEKYLELPRELLITVMMRHQRYFPVETRDGALASKFVAFSNIRCADMAHVRAGYERVLEARLSDARFFFDEDRKHPLTHFKQKLSGINYMKGLGTVADKVDRVAVIAAEIAKAICPGEMTQVIAAAELCKADLATQIVFEFPELQGIMGREYAKAEGIAASVARTVDEHYLPRFSGDALPSTPVATCVALADKIEALAGCFALGLVPTGSEDPFSLRRHALGIIRILLAGANVGLKQIVAAGIGALPNGLKANAAKAEADLTEFFAGRIKGEFLQRRLTYDVIDSVLAAGFDALPDALARCEALQNMKSEPYAEALSTTFRRAANISKEHPATAVDEAALTEPVEKELLAALQRCAAKALPLKAAKDYAGVLRETAGIRGAVDAFFDGVMVNDGDELKKRNRLGLLRRVTNLFGDIADFSKLAFKE